MLLEIGDDDDGPNQKADFNALVQESVTDPELARNQRMRWLSQICEYWPLRRLANVTDADVQAVLTAYRTTTGITAKCLQRCLFSAGTITLAGSGPGHPSLLTLAAQSAIKISRFHSCGQIGTISDTRDHTATHTSAYRPEVPWECRSCPRRDA